MIPRVRTQNTSSTVYIGYLGEHYFEKDCTQPVLITQQIMNVS